MAVPTIKQLQVPWYEFRDISGFLAVFLVFTGVCRARVSTSARAFTGFDPRDRRSHGIPFLGQAHTGQGPSADLKMGLKPISKRCAGCVV